MKAAQHMLTLVLNYLQWRFLSLYHISPWPPAPLAISPRLCFTSLPTTPTLLLFFFFFQISLFYFNWKNPNQNVKANQQMKASEQSSLLQWMLLLFLWEQWLRRGDGVTVKLLFFLIDFLIEVQFIYNVAYTSVLSLVLSLTHQT